MMKYHVLERTSSKGKGKPFVGKCILCGKENLLPKAIWEECSNPNKVSSDIALIKAITHKNDLGLND